MTWPTGLNREQPRVCTRTRLLARRIFQSVSFSGSVQYIWLQYLHDAGKNALAQIRFNSEKSQLNSGVATLRLSRSASSCVNAGGNGLRIQSLPREPRRPLGRQVLTQILPNSVYSAFFTSRLEVNISIQAKSGGSESAAFTANSPVRQG